MKKVDKDFHDQEDEDVEQIDDHIDNLFEDVPGYLEEVYENDDDEQEAAPVPLLEEDSKISHATETIGSHLDGDISHFLNDQQRMNSMLKRSFRSERKKNKMARRISTREESKDTEKETLAEVPF